MANYTPSYPLLEALLAQLGLSLKGRYTISDAAQIFGVSRRTIQDWIRDGKINARKMRHYRFLSEDLEAFFQNSLIKRPSAHAMTETRSSAKRNLEPGSETRRPH
jgi:excisionase family DNA binding protein